MKCEKEDTPGAERSTLASADGDRIESPYCRAVIGRRC